MARAGGARQSEGERRPPAAGAEIVPLPWSARRTPRPSPKPPLPRSGDPDDYPVNTRTLIAIGAFVVLFIVTGVWLLETMRNNALLEECLMAGRKNCVPISLPLPER